MAVYMELAPGDTLVVGKSRIRLERKSGQRARLMIDSTDDIERVKAGEAVPPSAPPAQAGSPPASHPLHPNTPFLKRPLPAAS